MNRLRVWLQTCPTITTATITALVSAIMGLVVAFGAELTRDQTRAILIVVGVLAPLITGGIAKLQTVPATAVVAHQDPGTGVVLAGQAAPEPTGTEIEVETTPVEHPPEHATTGETVEPDEPPEGQNDDTQR